MSGIGIALLVILIVIISLLVIVLISPVTYRIDINGRHPYTFEGKLSWLYRIFSVHVRYEQGKPFFKEVYLLGRMKIGPARDYEEWLAKRVEEEVDMEESKQYDEPISIKEAHIEEKDTEPVIEKVVFTEDGNIQEIVCQSDDTVTGADDANHKKKTVFSSLQEFTATLADKKEQFHKKIDDVLQKDSKVPFDWWVPYVKNPALYKALYVVSKRMYDHFKPRKIYIEGTYGCGNAYYTGLVAGVLYSVWPHGMKDVRLEYIKPVCDGSGYIYGRIIPAAMAWYGTQFMVTKAVRTFVVAGMKVFFIKRKEAKAKQSVA